MRSTIFSIVFALLMATTMAVAPILKPVIISFDKAAPEDLLQQTKDMVLEAKGKVTHEYSIIKGFACEIPESLFESIWALSSEFPATIEGDGMVHTQGGKKDGEFKVGIN